jgi:hypothetical protein
LTWVQFGLRLQVRAVTLCFRDEDRAATLHAVLLHLLLVWLDVGARAWVDLQDSGEALLGGESFLSAAKSPVLARVGRLFNYLVMQSLVISIGSWARSDHFLRYLHHIGV